jgi:hypothetical protein
MWIYLGRLSFAARAGILGGCVALAWAATMPLAYWSAGAAGAQAASVAAGVCFAGTILALATTEMLSGPLRALYGVLLGMFARTGLPLVATLVIYFKVPALADAGLVVYLLVFYFLTLVVETVLAISCLRQEQPSPGDT